MRLHRSWDANRHQQIARDLVSVGRGYVRVGDQAIMVAPGEEESAARMLKESLAPVVALLFAAFGRVEGQPEEPR